MVYCVIGYQIIIIFIYILIYIYLLWTIIYIHRNISILMFLINLNIENYHLCSLIINRRIILDYLLVNIQEILMNIN